MDNLDTEFRDSSTLNFTNFNFLSDPYEYENYDGENVLVLYFSVEGYCAVENARKTLYSNIRFTNIRRVGETLEWDDAEMECIAEWGYGNSYFLRFSDVPQNER